MVRAGIPKHTAMQLSGHRTASVFDRYDIHDLADLEAATAILSQRTDKPSSDDDARASEQQERHGHVMGTFDEKTAPEPSEPRHV